MRPRPHICAGCDTMVALAPATAAGITLFAKNSDRPALEPQPLRQFAAERHAPGSTVHTQYLEIPQAERTAAMIGSQPHWLWGFEHGMNEHRVAIGNESVFTREHLGERGLLGMDLVRLGLERARTAEEALAVITGLMEEHGQGGAGYVDLDFRYNNSFLIGDPDAAWILETSDRRWAARPAGEVDSISNHVSITDDWERTSADLVAFAQTNGWDGGNGKFNFQAAYRDSESVPPIISEGRLRQSRALLGDMRSHVTPARLRTVLRDHYDGSLVYRGGEPSEETYFSLCMHADPVGTTTASMIAQLPADPARIPVYWASLATPCTSVFMPLFLDGTIPPALARAAAEPTADSPWWQCKAIQDACAPDFPALTPKVQAIFHAWEAEMDPRVDAVRVEAEAHRAAGRSDAARDLLTAFMDDAYLQVEALRREALGAVGGAGGKAA